MKNCSQSKNKIPYHIRIRENFDVLIPRNNHVVKVSWLFRGLKMRQFKHYPKIVYINKVACYLSASVIKSKTGQPEYQFLISFNNPKDANQCYKRRWQIETMFKALKSSGFNLEDTHLKDPDRIPNWYQWSSSHSFGVTKLESISMILSSR